MSPLVETVALEHLPVGYLVHLAFFRDVENAAFLHSQLLARNADFEYAFIDATSLVSRLHLLAAVYKAVNSLLDSTLKTPNVHSEVVSALNASNNIAEAYRRFGINATTSALVVAKVVFPTTSTTTAGALSADDVARHLATHVRGTSLPLTDAELQPRTDWPKVRKCYKLNGLPWLDSIPDDARRKRETEQLILSAMALRGI